MSQVLRATLKVADGGQIAIPPEIRERLGIEAGSAVVLSVEGDRVILMHVKAARGRARERVRQFIPANTKLSEELITERKAGLSR